VLTTRSLSVFLAVVREGSITKASHTLHLTQPAVSLAIKKLEVDVGFALFSRHGGKLNLTEEGANFHLAVESALQGVDELNVLARELRRGAGRTLRLFSMSSALNDIIPLAMPTFWTRYPAATISIESRRGSDLNEWGLGRKFDLGIIMLPSGQSKEVISAHINTEAYALEPIGDTPAIVIMQKGHRLEAREEIDFKDLEKDRLIAMRPNSNIRHWLDRQFAESGIMPAPALESATMTSAAHFAACGLGVTIADPFSFRSLKDGASFRPLRANIGFTFSFAVPRERPRSPLVEYFKRAVCECSRPLFDQLQSFVRSDC